MARPVVLVLGAVLAASVAANVYQWQQRTSATADDGATTATGPGGSGPPSTPGARVADNGSAGTGAPVKRPEGAPPPLAATCVGQLADLGDRLARAEAKLEARLSFEEKFERSPPAPESEARLSPLVAKVFEKAPPGYSFEIECRGEICDVSITEPEKGDFEWSMKLQQDVYHSEGEGHAMFGSRPSHDPVTKEALRVSRTLVQLNGAGTADGMPVLQALVEQLRNSGAATRCADGARGYLSLQLWLSGDPAKITYEVGGTLASSSSGRCVLATLDQLIATATIPPRTRTAVLHHVIEL